MADREFWDIGMWKETKSGKNFFIKLGSATQNEDGGFTCYMDALPIPGPKGGCRMTIKPQQRREYGGGSPAPAASDPFDSDAPF